MSILKSTVQAQWEALRTQWQPQRVSRSTGTTGTTRKLQKLKPGAQVYRYDLEKTSFEHIPQCHRAKKQLLHDLFWMPGVSKFLGWVARKYDAGRRRPVTPETSETVTLHFANDDDDADECSELLSDIDESIGDDSANKTTHNDVKLYTSFITNPDPIPPSPSTVFELHGESLRIESHDMSSGQACRRIQKKAARVSFSTVSYKSTAVSSDSTKQVRTVTASAATSVSPTHITPMTAAFAAFNKSPTSLRHWVDKSEPVPCRLYVRALESYADGIISIEKGDKLFVTAQRGAYLRFESFRSVVGWFPKVYCEVICDTSM